MTMTEIMMEKYGPLLNVSQMASLFGRSDAAFRMSIRRSGEWPEKINSTKIKIGRRVYFKTAQVAQLLTEN